MSTRRLWGLAAAALSGGCALASGYDFGKYTETGGTGGAGASGSSGAGAASTASTGGRPVAASASASTGDVGPASASSSSTTGATASSSGNASSSSTGSGGSTTGTVKVLYDNLLGPENLAVDAQLVYFTLNVPGQKGKSGAGYVSKDGSKQDLWYSSQDAVPAIWSTGSLVYFSSNLGGEGYVYAFDPAANQVQSVSATQNVSMQGLAVWGATVFFTTLGSNTWYIPPAGQPGTFVPNDIAAGPITADATGVFFVDDKSNVMQAPLNGGSATSIGLAPHAVWAMTTDPSSVYWTDNSGGLHSATKGSNVVKTLAAPDMVAAYGLAVDSSDTRFYFAHGQNVEYVSFPFGAPPVTLTFGLTNPRGVAVDDTYVYVADYGTGTAADGRILRITR